MCGFKGPSSKYTIFDEVFAAYRSSVFYCAYQKQLIYESFRDSDSNYDKIYARVYKEYTTNFGMLNGAKYVCDKCFKGLKALEGAPSIPSMASTGEPGSTLTGEVSYELAESESDSK